MGGAAALGMRSRAAMAEGPEVAATRTENHSERAWLAIEALSRKPFDYSTASTFKLYMEMFSHVSTWAPDLQNLLPPDAVRQDGVPTVQTDDLYLHLGEVVLLMLERWLAQVKHTRADERAVAEFCSTLPAIENALASLRSRFVDLEPRKDDVQRLLQDVRRIQDAGHQVREIHAGRPASAFGGFSSAP